jgi:hypothetical protein
VVCKTANRERFAFEAVSQSTISLRRKLLEQNKYDQIYAAAEKQSKMLSGLRKSLVEA